MSSWSEDFSGVSLTEILHSQVENRAWHKVLRTRSSALVNSRLAKRITHDDYLESRSAADREAAECERRAGILTRELVKHGRR